jgi:pimeloyl-ACP methyl ester carboxylesterase
MRGPLRIFRCMMAKRSAAFAAALLVFASSAPDAESAAASGSAFRKRTLALATGITVSYVEVGAPEGDPVILLHGLSDTSRSFFGTLEALQSIDRGLRLFALDARGHGDSSLPAALECPAAPERCFRVEDFAADVLAFMDAKGLRRAHVVGHSMGAAHAQHVALAHPERVQTLVLIGGFVNGVDSPTFHAFLISQMLEGRWKATLLRRPGFRWPQDAYRLTSLEADPSVLEWNRKNWVVDPVADPELLRAVNPETARTPLGTWIGTLRSMAAFDNREALTRLSVPTLVIWATQDNAFPADPDQAQLRAALDAAAAACRTTYVYKTYGKQALPASGQQESDIGHNVQWGAPRAVASDIASFIRTGRPTAERPYADPTDVRRVLTERSVAAIEVRGCAAGAATSPR